MLYLLWTMKISECFGVYDYKAHVVEDGLPSIWILTMTIRNWLGARNVLKVWQEDAKIKQLLLIEEWKRNAL